jgi:dTDP-4-amino-4,6-dideoxygalactose transaminase
MRIIPQAAPALRVTRHRLGVEAAFRRVLDNGTFILGPETKTFESEFARHLNVDHCIGVSSGTDALVLALQVLGVGPGDEVLVPALTAPATAAAVLRLGASPTFVDIEPVSRGMDPDLVPESITSKTKAVVVVHLHGIPARIEELAQVCEAFGLPLIEDCAQAQGTTVNGKKAGTFGKIAAFSFYPTKNLGGIGDGGCVATNSAELAGRLYRLRNYGFNDQGFCVEAGINNRLDEMQAAVLRLFLSHLDDDNQARRDFSRFYDGLFKNSPRGSQIQLPPDVEGNVYHQYAICTSERDHLAKVLMENGVGTLVHYAIPLHKHPAFAKASQQNDRAFPVAEELAGSLLSLPIQPELRVYEQEIGRAIETALTLQS